MVSNSARSKLVDTPISARNENAVVDFKSAVGLDEDWDGFELNFLLDFLAIRFDNKHLLVLSAHQQQLHCLLLVHVLVDLAQTSYEVFVD